MDQQKINALRAQSVPEFFHLIEGKHVPASDAPDLDDTAKSEGGLVVTGGVRTGVMHINTYGGADGAVPMGDVGQSGDGSDKSLQAFEKYINLKTAWIQL